MKKARKLELYNFEKGDCVVITNLIDPKNLNFRKTAETWIGRNIYPIKKSWTTGVGTFTIGTVMHIAIDNDKCYKISRASYSDYYKKIPGYVQRLSYEIYFHEFLTLLLAGGYAKVIKYNELPINYIMEFGAMFKLSRLHYAMGYDFKETLIYQGTDEVIKIENQDNGNIILKVTNPIDGRQKPDIYVKIKDILSKEFITTSGEQIDGDPFNTKYSNLN